jgi:D-glycero-D-manno-heptose 1,7-bisphosphate phosphatase
LATEPVAKPMPRAAILLDRDGVLIEAMPEGEYVREPHQVRIPDGVRDAIGILKTICPLMFVVTNQAGVAKGTIKLREVERVNDAVNMRLGYPITAFHVCPHGPEDGCLCRKPLPGLFYQVALERGVDLNRILYIGDHLDDFQAALSAGVPVYFHLDTGRGPGTWKDVLWMSKKQATMRVYRFVDLASAARRLSKPGAQDLWPELGRA